MKKLGIWLSLLLMTAQILLGTGIKTFAAEAVQIRIPVSVLAEGSEPDPKAVYTLEVIPVTEDSPAPDHSRLRLLAGEPGSIGFICDRAGVFDYTVRQIPGTDPDCTYDDRSFRLRLFVTETEGTLSASAVVYGEQGDKEPQLLFRNRWADPAYVVFTAWKTLDGMTPEEGAFTFRLLEADGTLLYQEENKGRRVTFQPIRYDREGTYRYELKEQAETGDKIIYDRTVYTATVKVTKDTDYHAEVTWQRNGKPYSGIPVFTNYTEGTSPKTGDTIGIYGTVLLLSAAGLILLLRKQKKAR